MKRLILIQNDFASAGKTTLGRCLHQYLENYQVPHHLVVLTESPDEVRGFAALEADSLKLTSFIPHLDESDLVILEVETGMAELFNKFSEKNDLPSVLEALGFDLVVAVPITGESESYDGITEAAEVFSDAAQYLIVHTPSSTVYDQDKKRWEHSYSARVMDMFEAVDMEMPSTQHQLDRELLHRHTDLATTLQQSREEVEPCIQEEVQKWSRRVAAQLDTVRKYAFGDAFRPGVAITPPAGTHKRKPRAKALVDSLD